MYSYCVWPWLCKQSSLRGQFIQTLKEHSFTLTARAIRPCTKPWFNVPYVYQRIQRRWMVFKRDKQKPIHLHYRMSARLSLSLNLSTWNWNHPARLQATSDKWEKKMFRFVFFLLKIFLTRETVLVWAFVTLIRYSRDAAVVPIITEKKNLFLNIIKIPKWLHLFSGCQCFIHNLEKWKEQRARQIANQHPAYHVKSLVYYSNSYIKNNRCFYESGVHKMI